MDTRHLLYWFLVGACVISSQVHARSRRREEIKTMQIVEPSLRNDEGQTIEYVIARGIIQRRHKRSTIPQNGDDERFDLQLGVDNITLQLGYLSRIVSPHSRLLWMENNVTYSREIQDGCLYQGHIMNNENSYGVFNLCSGVSGVLSSATEDMFIAPADQTKKGIRRPHVLTRTHKSGKRRDFTYARRADKKKRCGVGNEARDVHASPVQHGRYRRATHSGSRKYVEVLIATDNSVVDFHGRDLVEQYLLTQMHIVNHVYQHESLGVNLEIVVVDIIVLDDKIVDMVISQGNAKYTLDRFCQWSHYQRPVLYPHNGEVDMAVYLTRNDIGPAGYAPVTGMCNPIRSCTVNRDDGISSAFVVAHEMGHVFGLRHDGQETTCDGDPEDGKIMAGYVQASYNMHYWTNCSREQLLADIDGMYCLNNAPQIVIESGVERPFGMSWSLDQQCRQEFGEDFQLCTAWVGNPCEYLWCSTRQSPLLCKTKRGPPLPGTECAPGKWCMSGRCVQKDRGPRDGGWSQWNQWGYCNRDCGTGIRFRERLCNDPEPAEGGRPCVGTNEDFELCNMQPCAADLPDFRAMQCTWLNPTLEIGGRKHTWFPADNTDESTFCKLTCASQETGERFVSEDDVMDGTLCSYRTMYNVCVKGTCYDVGCDGVVGSSMMEDACGICGGDGTSCLSITGTFTGYTEKIGYYKVVILPRGARNVEIRQDYPTEHFLALREASETNGHYFINGDGQNSGAQMMILNSIQFDYITKTTGDAITSRGPLGEPMVVSIYSTTLAIPVHVSYRYDFPNERIYDLFNENLYGFPLNEAFDTTYQDMAAEAHREETVKPTKHVVPTTTTSATTTTTTTTRPTTTTAERRTSHSRTESPSFDNSHLHGGCGKRGCTDTTTESPRGDSDFYFWQMGAWSGCSVTCGHGHISREIYCIDLRTDAYVDVRFCNQNHRPNRTEPCDESPCLRWEVGQWEECTRPCGKHGRQERPLYCVTNFYGEPTYVDMAYCDATQMPQFIQDCNRVPCQVDWFALPWSPCSVSCGSGLQTRLVICDKPSDGDLYECIGEKPSDARPCHLSSCPEIHENVTVEDPSLVESPAENDNIEYSSAAEETSDGDDGHDGEMVPSFNDNRQHGWENVPQYHGNNAGSTASLHPSQDTHLRTTATPIATTQPSTPPSSTTTPSTTTTTQTTTPPSTTTTPPRTTTTPETTTHPSTTTTTQTTTHSSTTTTTQTTTHPSTTTKTTTHPRTTTKTTTHPSTTTTTQTTTHPSTTTQTTTHPSTTTTTQTTTTTPSRQALRKSTEAPTILSTAITSPLQTTTQSATTASQTTVSRATTLPYTSTKARTSTETKTTEPHIAMSSYNTHPTTASPKLTNQNTATPYQSTSYSTRPHLETNRDSDTHGDKKKPQLHNQTGPTMTDEPPVKRGPAQQWHASTFNPLRTTRKPKSTLFKIAAKHPNIVRDPSGDEESMPSTRTTTAVPLTSCAGDRSFFCRMVADARQCHLHLYRTMCCATCIKHLA